MKIRHVYETKMQQKDLILRLILAVTLCIQNQGIHISKSHMY